MTATTTATTDAAYVAAIVAAYDDARTANMVANEMEIVRDGGEIYGRDLNAAYNDAEAARYAADDATAQLRALVACAAPSVRRAAEIALDAVLY